MLEKSSTICGHTLRLTLLIFILIIPAFLPYPCQASLYLEGVVMGKVTPEMTPEEVINMYTACTCQLAYAMNLSFLLYIPKYFWFFAITAWVLAFLWTIAFLVKPSKKVLFPSKAPLLTLKEKA